MHSHLRMHGNPPHSPSPRSGPAVPAASTRTPLGTPGHPAAGRAEQERDQGDGVLSDARRGGNHAGKGGHLCRGLHTHTGAPGPCLSAPLVSCVLPENIPGFEENEVTSRWPWLCLEWHVCCAKPHLGGCTHGRRGISAVFALMRG